MTNWLHELHHSAFLSLGFRPFYLLASGFCAFTMATFLVAMTQIGIFDALLYEYHAHEFVFGFACAVLVGFLLTAVQNWSGRRTLWGLWLGGLGCLWLLGRLGMWFASPPISGLLDSLFLPLATLAIAWPILQSKNYRNLALVVVLLLLTFLNVLFHSRSAGLQLVQLPVSETKIALSLFSLVITLMAGRVIPAFTRNAVPHANVRTNKVIEVLSFLTIGIVSFTYFLPIDLNYVIGGIALMGVVVHMYRLLLWDVWSTRQKSLLWIPGLGYLWIPIYLGISAIQHLGLSHLDAIAIHALSAGAIGTLMVAMMTRSARGHTGRPLIADRYDLTMYALIVFGAVVRVFGVMSFPQYTQELLWVAGLAWSLGFLLFFVVYFQRLTSKRLDGISISSN